MESTTLDFLRTKFFQHKSKETKELFKDFAKYAVDNEIVFKDPATALSYFYKVEDGECLSQLKFNKEDVQLIGRRSVPTDKLAKERDSVSTTSAKARNRVVASVASTSGICRLDSQGSEIEKDHRRMERSSDKATGKEKPYPSELICKICMTDHVEILMVPCSHVVSCLSCSAALTQCPLCRTSIKATIKVNV